MRYGGPGRDATTRAMRNVNPSKHGRQTPSNQRRRRRRRRATGRLHGCPLSRTTPASSSFLPFFLPFRIPRFSCVSIYNGARVTVGVAWAFFCRMLLSNSSQNGTSTAQCQCQRADKVRLDERSHRIPPHFIWSELNSDEMRSDAVDVNTT